MSQSAINRVFNLGMNTLHQPSQYTDIEEDLSAEKKKGFKARLTRLCLPVRLNCCYSVREQRLLFTLMDMIIRDESLKHQVLPELIAFLETLHFQDVVWLSAIESGFALNFIKKLLEVSPQKEKEVITAFIAQQMTLLSNLLSALESDPNEQQQQQQLRLLQVLFHSIASTKCNQWILHQKEIINVAKFVSGRCAPYQLDLCYQSTVASILACDTLLDLLPPAAESNQNPLGADLGGSVNDIVGMILLCSKSLNRTGLTKSAVQALLKTSLYLEDTSIDSSIQHLADFLTLSPTWSIRRVLYYHLFQSQYSTEASDASSKPELADLDLNAAREIGEILESFLQWLSKCSNSAACDRATTVIANALTKWITSITKGDTTLEKGQPSDNCSTPSILSHKQWSSTESSNVVKKLIFNIGSILNLEYKLLSHEKSSCFGLIRNSLELLTTETVLVDNELSPSAPLIGADSAAVVSSIEGSPTTSDGDYATLSLCVLNLIVYYIEDSYVINYVFDALCRLQQKRLSGRILSLVTIILADIMKRDLGSHDVSNVANLSLKLLCDMGETIVSDCKEIVEEFTLHPDRAKVLKSRLNTVGERARAICNGINAFSKSFLEQKKLEELDARTSQLIDYLLLMMIELIPLTKQSNELGILASVIEISSAFLESIAICMEGLFKLQTSDLESLALGVSTGTVSKYIRLWMVILICQAKAQLLAPECRGIIKCIPRIAKVTPPLFFAWQSALPSTSVDLMDELISTDASLGLLIMDCIFKEDKIWLREQFKVAPSGITPASFFLFSAIQLLESTRAQKSCDIRPLAGYILDKSNCVSAKKRDVMGAITDLVEDMWLRSIGSNLEQFHSGLVRSNDVGGFATIVGFQIALEDQISFLLERVIDERDAVRRFSAHLLSRLLTEVPWVLVNLPQSMGFALEIVSWLEKAARSVTAHNPHDPKKLEFPVPGRGFKFDHSVGSPEGIKELRCSLRFKAMLPPISFPQREDRFAIVSQDLFRVIYSWFFAPGFTSNKKPSFIAELASKLAQDSGAVAPSIIQEVTANTSHPVFHLHPDDSLIFSKSRADASKSVALDLGATTTSRDGKGNKMPILADVRAESSRWKLLKESSYLESKDVEMNSLFRLFSTAPQGSSDGSKRSSFLTLVDQINLQLQQLREDDSQVNGTTCIKIIKQLNGLANLLAHDRKEPLTSCWTESQALTDVSGIINNMLSLIMEFHDKEEVLCHIFVALENIYQQFPRFQWQLGAIIISALNEAFIILFSVYKAVPCTVDIIVQFMDNVIDVKSIVGYTFIRHFLESSLYHISHETNASHERLVSLSNLPVIRLVAMGIKSLKSYHLLQSRASFVSSNRILRENISLTILSLLTNDVKRDKVNESKYLNASPRSPNHDKARDEIASAAEECRLWSVIMSSLLEDQKHWYIDYAPSLGRRLSAPVRRESIVSAASSAGSSSGEPNNDSLSTDRSKIFYGGPDAAAEEIMDGLCKFSKAIKRLARSSSVATSPTLLPASGSSGNNILMTPKVVDALQFQRTLGMGHSKGSGLTVSVKKTNALLLSCGTLSAMYMLILQRLDCLSSRYLVNFGSTTAAASSSSSSSSGANSSADQRDVALNAIAALRKIVDIKLFQSLKSYKLSIKSAWVISPTIALSFKDVFQHLSLGDGRRKGINHLALFVSINASDASQCRDYRTLSLILDTIYHPSTSAVDQSICLNSIDLIEEAPLFEVIRILSRCGDMTDSWQDKSQHLLPGLVRFILRNLYRADISQVLFYLPQLVQLLRRDDFGLLADYLICLSQRSTVACHRLFWLLQTESKYTSHDEKQLSVLLSKYSKKRESCCGCFRSSSSSGQQQQQQQQKQQKAALERELRGRLRYGLCGELHGLDTLPFISQFLLERMTTEISPKEYEYLQNQVSLFSHITNISAKLKETKEKDTHVAVIHEQLRGMIVPHGMYLPTNEKKRVISIDIASAAPMQSAAKCPFLLKFVTVRWKGPDAFLAERSSHRSAAAAAGRDKNAVTVTGIAGTAGKGTGARPNLGINTGLVRDSTVNFAEDEVVTRSPKATVAGIGKKGGTFNSPKSKSKHGEEVTGTQDISLDFADAESESEGAQVVAVLSKASSLKRLPSQLTRKSSSFTLPPQKFTSPAQIASTRALATDTATSVEGKSKKKLKAQTKRRGADSSAHSGSSSGSGSGGAEAVNGAQQSWEACIFKVHDDIRQDMLTLQVVLLLKNWYAERQLPVHLSHYNVLCNRSGPSGALGGIIEVIKGVKSRDQLGKSGAKTLLQLFVAQFGQPGSETFSAAQVAFASSLAAYAVLSYLLHIKDRHNGNIMIDQEGHIIHIDFGFILGISPGKNMGFESAPFKLTREMIEVLGGTHSETFKKFKMLTIQAFLAAREVMNPILALVFAYADSQLPCFQYKRDVLLALYKRFVPAMTCVEAGDYMDKLIKRASQHWTTVYYDGIQKLQNNIYSVEWR